MKKYLEYGGTILRFNHLNTVQRLRPPGRSIIDFSAHFNKAVLLSYAVTLFCNDSQSNQGFMQLIEPNLG